MKIRIVLAVLLIVLFGAFLVILTRPEAKAEPIKVASAADCRACHPEVYAEWKASWHAMAWTDPLVRDPQQADNFKKKDCIPCHAPRPIFERGIRPGERVVERAALREDGVDCNSCHKLPEGGFAANTEDPEGPCLPVFHPALKTEALCAPCHNQHNTVNEWLDAPAELRGETCNDCHMPVVDRNGRPGRSHLFPGGHFPEILKQAFSLSHKVKGEGEERKLIITLANDKSGHNFPTDSRHRAVDLVLTLYDENGLPLPAVDPPQRESGQERGTYRLRFRNPYRSEYGKEDTQIPAGEARVLEAPLTPMVGSALIEVIYKLTPFMTDSEGANLSESRIDLANDT